MYYKVVLRGPGHTRSGYGEYVRGFARVLSQFDEFDVTLQSTPWGNTPLIFDKNHWAVPMLGKMTQNTAQEAQAGIKYDVSFQVQLPNEWDPSIAEFNVGVTAATEVDRVCEGWQRACNQMDLVIAMSEHTKKSLMTGPTAVTTPIIVFGSPLKDDFLSDEVAPYPLELDESIEDVFLHIGQLVGDVNRDRKNTFGMIAAFKHAFADDPTKALVVKTNMGRNGAVDRMHSRSTLQAFIQSTVPNSKAKVYLLHGNMTDAQMAGLYVHPKMRAFVSFTRGEGFGLPFQEAAAMGLPVIATNHSSYLDFLCIGGTSHFSKVDFLMNEVGPQYVDGQIIPPGSKWAEVPPQAAVSALQKFVKKGPSKPQEWAAALKESTRDRYSIENMKIDLFKKLQAACPEFFSTTE